MIRTSRKLTSPTAYISAGYIRLFASNKVTLATAGAGSRKVELIVLAAAETEKIGLGYALTGFIFKCVTHLISLEKTCKAWYLMLFSLTLSATVRPLADELLLSLP